MTDENDNNENVDNVDDPIYVSTSPIKDSEDLEYFTSGNSLVSEDIYNILRKGNARVVIIAGSVKSGKTTLLSAIYEKFQHGASEHFLFSGSESLIGFEKCTHHSRLGSGGDFADTPRTSLEDEYRYMHLNLTSKDTLNRTDILLSDVSGELFDALIKNEDQRSKHEVVSRADHLVCIIDGAKIISLVTRDRNIGDCLTILRRLKENSMIRSCTKIQIIISKYDLINKLEASEKAEIDLVIQNIMESKIKKIFDLNEYDIKLYKMAARVNPTERSDIENIIDVDDLLKGWINYRPLSRGVRLAIGSSRSNRLIDKFSI